MLKSIFSVLFLSSVCVANTAKAQPSNTIVNNLERAHTLLTDVYSEVNYGNTVGDVSMRLTGTYKYEGITGKPGSAREFVMASDIVMGNGGTQVVRKDTFTRQGEDIITSFYDIGPARINVTEANEELKLTDKDKTKYLYKSLIFSPNMLLQMILSDASGNNFISTDDKYHIIRHNNTAGEVYFLYINSKTYFLEKIDMPFYDVTSGDHFRTITYSDYNIIDGYQAPGKVTISKDTNVIYKLKIELREILPRTDYGTQRLTQKSVGQWLHVIPLPEWNSRAVVADLKDFLVVFEPPANAEAGYTLLDNIKRAYPNKEIRYCVVSHHHPEHMGGIRPFIEEGSIIVTTEGNRNYFTSIARNKHMFSKDVRVKKALTPKFQFITMNRYEIRAADRIIQFFLLNKYSQHADEYIISYIPSEKILIEGDLVKTSNLRKERQLSKQEQGLADFIEAEKINVKQIIQTWPLENSPHTFDYSIIRPESSNKLIQGTKKIMDVFN